MVYLGSTSVMVTLLQDELHLFGRFGSSFAPLGWAWVASSKLKRNAGLKGAGKVVDLPTSISSTSDILGLSLGFS